jgi:hypothetical protein
MLKIPMITSYYRSAYVYGGPARSIQALCEGIARPGTAVTVFTTDATFSGRLDVTPSVPVS